MAVVGFFHHIGTFLLLVATALLIVTDVSSPVVHNLAILKVDLGGDFCSPSQVGYSPAAVMSDAESTQFSVYASDTTRALTKVMILHPIATGICFIAFALTLGAGVVGSFLASLVSLLAFLITAVVLITDFVLFSVVRSNINDSRSGSQAYYSTAMWTLLVAAICTLLATFVVFFTCCSARMHRQRTTTVKTDYGEPAGRRRRRRWF